VSAITPLQQFLVTRGIPSARLEALLEERLKGRAPSRRQFLRWRRTGNIRRKDMVRILWAAREAAHDPAVRIDDLFDVDPDNEANWRD
jgi:hypothetical protein